MSSAATEKAPKAKRPASGPSAKPARRKPKAKKDVAEESAAEKSKALPEAPCGATGEPGPEHDRPDGAGKRRKSVSELNAYELGREGEQVAASYLERRGYEILDTNWKTHYGEVDIVARDGEEIVLVEVKTRLCVGPDAPEMPEIAVDDRKQRRYRSFALYYLAEHPEEDIVRFDVIAINIIGERLAKLRHLVGAFACDD